MNIKSWIDALPKGAMVRLEFNTASKIFSIHVAYNRKRTTRYLWMKELEAAKGDAILCGLEIAAKEVA